MREEQRQKRKVNRGWLDSWRSARIFKNR